MDKKRKESVLRFLLDYYIQNGRHFYKDLSDICQSIPDIPRHIMEATLYILKEEGLVNFITADNMPTSILLTPSGLAYFERQKQEKQEKWTERKWNFFQMLIGYVLGFLSGLGIAWLSRRFF
ncbi:MAG: hypothetical protein K6T66_06530 [Peptococcaceae bacterium]|nr:hypothetical protein [Peptococcaceae bacterium]